MNTYYALGVFLLPFDQMWLRQTRRVYTARERLCLHSSYIASCMSCVVTPSLAREGLVSCLGNRLSR